MGWALSTRPGIDEQIFFARRGHAESPQFAGAPDANAEPLGTKTIEGTPVTGTRDTKTISAGMIGNDKDLVITHETRYSPDLKLVIQSTQTDPRFGQTTYFLINIQRNEPDPALFQVPAGYKVEKKTGNSADDHAATLSAASCIGPGNESSLSWSTAMKCHRGENSEIQMFLRRMFLAAMFGALLVLAPETSGQHLAGSHSAGFSGGHMGGFSGGSSRGSFSTPHTFGNFSAPAPGGFNGSARMHWSAPRYNFAPRRNPQAVYRSPGAAGNHRNGFRPRYPGYGFRGYPYPYVNSWNLLPWDLGYPDSAGYDDQGSSVEPNNAQVGPQDGEPQENEGYRPEYAAAPYPAPANPAVASTPPTDEPKLTLIFNDGHTQAIRNYVLTPNDIIVMDNVAWGRLPRIQLTELNLPATELAARQNGLDFSPPSR